MGELGIIQSTVGLFTTLTGLGLGLAATRNVAEYRRKDPVLLGELIGLFDLITYGSAFLTSLVVFLSSPWLASHTLAAPHLSSQLQIAALLIFLGLITGIQTGLLSGFESFATIAKVNFVCGVANFPLLIAGAHWGGLNGVVWGLVVVQVLNCVLNHVCIRAELKRNGIAPNYHRAGKHISVIWSFGLPCVLAGVISGPANWYANAVLANQPGGYAELGILNVANNWFQAVAFLPHLMNQVLLPIISDYSATGEIKKLKQALMAGTLVNFAVAFPVILGCSLFSARIMSLYGPEFASGQSVLIITMITAGVVTTQGPITNHLYAYSKMWDYFWTQAVWMVGFGLLATWLIPSSGSNGLATARLFAHILAGLAIWLACASHLKKLTSPKKIA